MPIPAGVIAVGSQIAQGVGNAIGQGQQNQVTREQLAEQRRQFDIANARQHELGSRNQQLSEGQFANQLGRQMQTAPIRDRAAFALQNRLGMSSTAFQPRDIFNGSQVSGGPPPQQGGVDLNALAQQNAGYTRGAGGQMDQALQQAILRQIGYAPGKQGQGMQWRQPGGFSATTDPAIVAAQQREQELAAAREGVRSLTKRAFG